MDRTDRPTRSAKLKNLVRETKPSLKMKIKDELGGQSKNKHAYLRLISRSSVGVSRW